MVLKRFPLAALLVLMLALLPACAAGGAAAADAELGANAAAVRVNNNLIPPTSLTVWAVPQTGTRSLLGNVNPNGTATLGWDAVRVGGEFRLLAQTTAGQEIVSRPFYFDGSGVVEWSLQTNTVRVIE